MSYTFDRALEKLAGFEGAYSNDPDDPGGETIAGISRVHWPDWIGWREVDRQKSADGMVWISNELTILVRQFYRRNFYDPVGGDNLNFPALGIELFEMAVNIGTGPAVFILQDALNLLNRNGKSWPEISKDGDVGPKTLGTLHRAMAENNGAKSVVKMVNALQAEYYLDIIRRKSKMEKFIRGWLWRT